MSHAHEHAVGHNALLDALRELTEAADDRVGVDDLQIKELQAIEERFEYALERARAAIANAERAE